MIPVREYHDFWQSLYPEFPAISFCLEVDDETELAFRIKEISSDELFLVVVTPFADLSSTDEDNLGDVDTCLIYVIMKVDPANQSDEDRLNERELTQNTINAIRRRMLELQTSNENTAETRMMRQMVRGKQHIDRERNYLGCNGYSLSFSLKTNGI